MKAGFLYIMQYAGVTYIKGGRSNDAQRRLEDCIPGTVLHLTIVTSDMRKAEAAMLASLRSAQAVAEGIEAMQARGWGTETFEGPFAKIARRVTDAARLFPAERHNLMSKEAAREWYEREKKTRALPCIEQFLVDNECLTDMTQRRRPLCAGRAKDRCARHSAA